MLRRAVVRYLERVRRMAIRERYVQAYEDTSDLDDELEGWAEERVWLDE